MAIDGSIGDDLAGIVDARCRNESPARARWDEFVEVIHLAFAEDVRMLLPTGDCCSANDLATIVNASGVAERSAQRAQVAHQAVAPEAGVKVPGGRICQASHFATTIDGSPGARRATGERSEISDHTVAEDDGARGSSGEISSSDCSAALVDTGGEAGSPPSVPRSITPPSLYCTA